MNVANRRYLGVLLAGAAMYLIASFYNEPMDITDCGLCDAQHYLKVYEYFEHGTISQIKFPFYNRPFVPWLVSLLPGHDPTFGFHLINALFMLLSIVALKKLWNMLQINERFQWIGMGWLLLHWSGMIRYNLYDYITVDLPLYLFQPLAMIIFLKKDYRWMYLLAPVALLQKESFLVILFTMLAAHLALEKSAAWRSGKHLLFATVVGILIQKLCLHLLPEQLDQRSSLLAILYHGKWALEDPTRFIRWFAAFGSAFGVFPLLILFQVKRFWKKENLKLSPLLLLSIAYAAFGLLAGEDMTRIIFLGFPFIMTLVLISMEHTKTATLLASVLLSFVSLRLYPMAANPAWAVDYQSLAYVFSWATYYLIAAFVLLGIHFFSPLVIKKK